MASTLDAAAKEHGKNAEFRSLKRSWTIDSCASNQGSKACVCAPATHAGSFKCRLHRVNSHGPSRAPATVRPQPPVSTSSTRTVEAQ